MRMQFYVLTLFPEMIRSGMNTSITGRAMAKGLIGLQTVNIRDYAPPERKGRVDDYPYGGGAGMVMQAQPVYAAWESLCQASGRKIRTVYMTPQGSVFDQNKARELAREEELCLLCGHYEGIDERALDEIVTDSISIGDYVLTGGELPAMVVMDAVARMVPGVFSNHDSGTDESFMNGLLEYPQYTRPEEWNGRKVPEILLSGHHANVDKWRHEQALQRTLIRRPDLLDQAPLDEKDIKILKELKEQAKTSCGDI